MPETSPTPGQNRPQPGRFWRNYTALSTAVDHRFGWFGLKLPLGLADLVGIRVRLRNENLYDTTGQPAVDAPQAPADPDQPLDQRSSDGSWNDVREPTTGMAGTRFGRNVPIR